MPEKSKSFNKSLGVYLSIGGLALSLALLVALYFTPDYVFSSLEIVEVKALLAFAAPLLVACIGILVFYISHTPTARRLLLAAFRFILALGLSSSGFAILGWPQIRSFNLSRDMGLEAEFSLRDVAVEVGPLILYSAIAVSIVGALYLFVAWLEWLTKSEL